MREKFWWFECCAELESGAKPVIFSAYRCFRESKKLQRRKFCVISREIFCSHAAFSRSFLFGFDNFFL